MRCPKCRKEIAFEAIEHAVCGWKLASRQAPRRQAIPRPPPVNPEIRAKLDTLLAKFRSGAQAKIAKRPLAQPSMPEVTDGHGRVCCCEMCWPQRVKSDAARREEKAR